MTLVRAHGGGTVFLTLVVAMMLVLLPLPDMIGIWRPAWITLTLVYWCIALPQRVGVGTAWLAGLFVDNLSGALLGQHALALAVVAYLAVKLHLRVRVLPLWQQGVTVFVLVMTEQVLVLWTRGIQGLSTDWKLAVAPAVTSAIIWPWVFVILRDVRRRYRVT